MAENSIFLSAGDLSGDNAASRLLRALKIKDSNLSCFGLGGNKLKELNQEQLTDFNNLTVIGFWEVAQNYLFFRKLFKNTITEIKKRNPKAAILVDYPGFNLRLAKEIKKLGIPIIYYITPQVWAWGENRINQIKELVDLVIPILPFEQKFFEDNGINSNYVGHYLMEDIPKEYIASEPPSDGNLALLPGSRPQEVERMLKPMLETAILMNEKYGIKATVAGVRGCYDYEDVIRFYPRDIFNVVYDNPRKVIHDSQLVVTASGTATLETGIIGRPMVVIYKTGYLSYKIAKQLIQLDKIALVNLVLDEKVVPELIQNDATPQKILTKLENFYDDPSYYNLTRLRLCSLSELLGDGMASDKAADLILEFMKK